MLLCKYMSRPDFVQFTTLVGIAIEIPFALGEAFLGLEAFFIRYAGHKESIYQYSLSTFYNKFWISGQYSFIFTPIPQGLASAPGDCLFANLR